MINSPERVAHFTSSNAYKLIKFGARLMTLEENVMYKMEFPKGKKTTISKDGFASGGLTYIKQKKYEKLIGRGLSTEVKTRAMKWGSLMEIFLSDLMGMEYVPSHKKSLLHPVYGSFWSGTPDLIVPNVKTGEIKCFELEHFIDLSELLIAKDIQGLKENEPEAYWQAVSNSCIVGVPNTEIIAYLPYKTELEAIIDVIVEENFLERNGLEPNDYYFMSKDDLDSLPYLPDGCKYSNINSFEFEIPKGDIKLLESRMIEANEHLNN